MKKLLRVAAILTAAISLLSSCKPAPKDAQIEIKAVVVTMFEIGEDQGDKAGEFQAWKQGYGLTQQFKFPHGYHDIYLNPEKGVLGIVTGMGTAKASAAIMALGLDPRFELSKAYWLVAGIAGIDPQDGSIGSAVWAEYIVDGDLAHHIDAREIPENWQSGYFPLFNTEPTRISEKQVTAYNGEAVQLNPELARWAFALTKDISLSDTEAMQTLRQQYTNSQNAMAPPKVMMGDHLAASTFWHGEKLNDWANLWTKYWTNGKGNFVTSGMEDSGTYQSLAYLTNAGKADKNRLLVLRTASNFTMQPPTLSALENLRAESSGEGYAGMQPALDAAFNVGRVVLDNIVENWATYQHSTPGS